MQLIVLGKLQHKSIHIVLLVGIESCIILLQRRNATQELNGGHFHFLLSLIRTFILLATHIFHKVQIVLFCFSLCFCYSSL